MQSLIVVNQRVERQRYAQLMNKVASDLMSAQKKQMPLKQQYLISIENMKLQLHALKLSIGAQSSVGRTFREERKPSTLRAGAQAFTTMHPKLVSESSSDTESEPSDSSSYSSSEDDTIVVSACEDFDYTENSKLFEERKRALIGKTVVGRFKVFSPESGVTRYYLNWSSNKGDNIRLSPEVLEKSIGLENVQSGALMKATIMRLGPHYVRWDKQSPLTDKVAIVNRNGGNRNQRTTRKPRANSGGQRKQRSRSGTGSGPTRKIGRTTYR
jgi:hypothetical protein